MLDLTAIRLQWEPLSGSDTNGPHTATANTVVELLKEIEEQETAIDDLQDIVGGQQETIKALTAKLDSYNKADAAKVPADVPAKK